MKIRLLKVKDMWSVWFLLCGLAFTIAGGFVLEGSQTSYAQFRKWYPSPNSSIELEFLTDSSNGVILYTDDGGYYDFFELKLVDGSLRLRYNLGGGARVLSVGSGLGDGITWHRVQIVRNGTQTAMILDGSERVTSDANNIYVASKSSSATTAGLSSTPSSNNNNNPLLNEIEFGNFTTNSYVYVGGLPSWYSTKLSMLALPSVVFEPRFRGSIRNILYADDDTAKPRRQEVMAYKGVRASTVDACDHHNPCQNGGICISTDGGPICECQYIDYDGIFCEKGQDPPEVTFKGNEYLTYNLFEKSGEPILSIRDEVSLFFRTNRPEGLLFYTGDGDDYLNLALKDGGISLSINLGNGRLDTGINPTSVRFDDDNWHHVIITRVAQELSYARSVCHVTMTVDGAYTEKWMTSGSFTMLSSSKVFIGGSMEPYNLPGTSTKNNFAGCLKKVEFKADSLFLPLLVLAKEGHHLISSVGSVSFHCSPVEQIDPITFTSSASHLVLPTWNSTIGGSFSFKIRTNEPSGLLFFICGPTPGQGDFFALELFEGFLYLHLDLGSGALRLRASNGRLDDGNWHKIDLVRNRRTGTLRLDDESHDFETPGEASTLELASPMFVGGLNPDRETFRLPPVIWSANLRLGFVGCMRDVVVNGRAIDIVDYAQKQDSGSIRSSCHILPPKCDNHPCMNGGRCIDGWNRYICDCTDTGFTGPTCGKAAPTLHLDGSQHLTFENPSNCISEAENLSFRFRTKNVDTILILLRDATSTDRIELILEKGILKLSLFMGLTEKTIRLGDNLGDDKWHTVKFERRGMVMSLGIDHHRPVIAEIFGTDSFLDYTRLHVGAILPRDALVPPVKNYDGYIQQLIFNGENYFDQMKSGRRTELTMTGTFVPAKPGDEALQLYHTLSFENQDTYLGLSQFKGHYDINIFFQFRTTKPNGLIMYNAGKDQDFLAIELVNGHIHYVLNLGYGIIAIKDNSPKSLSDNSWHSVSIGRPTREKHTLMVDEHLAVAKSTGDNVYLDLDGILFLGGVRSTMYGKLPSEILSTLGFQGCLASIELNGEAADPIHNALVPSEYVSNGCEAFDGDDDERREKVGKKFLENLLKHPPLPLTTLGAPPHVVSFCTADTCSNRGVCQDQWISPACDCDLTSFTGPTCTDESVAYEWGPKPGLIRYYYDIKKRPDTQVDALSLGFITPLQNAVLLRVDSATTNDYLELEIVDGHIFVAYNPGSQDNAIGEMNAKVNDGRYHVVRFTRSAANSTLQVDDNQIQTKFPDGRQMAVFNSQSQIQIGGRYNPTLRRVERHFEGIIAGVVYNGLRPLDLAANADAKTKVQGQVRLLDNIPFDYREQNPRPFKSSGKSKKDDSHGMQRTNPSFVPEPGVNDDLIYGKVKCDNDQEKYYNPRCFTFEGSGDELITPVYTPPSRPEKSSEMPPISAVTSNGPESCDDEDDCLYNSSGDGGPDGKPGKGLQRVTTPRPYATTKPSYAYEVEVGTDAGLPPWIERDKDDEKDENGGRNINIPPHATLQPFPSLPSGTNSPQIVYENYDTKYNVYDKEPEPKPPTSGKGGGGVGGGFHVATEAAAPGTVLVIGIIAGAIIAIILIVIIVLKMRTRAEGAYKVEEARTYTFGGTATTTVVGEDTGFEAAPPSATTVVAATAIGGITTTSATKATVKPADNGFYNRHVHNKQKQNGSKPVKEWYV